MRKNLISSLTNLLPPALKVGKCKPDIVVKVNAQPFPVWLKQLLWWNWPTKSGGVWPCYEINSAKDILADELFPQLVAASMVPIGSTINGDTLVIRFADESAEVGFVSHEEVYSAANISDVYAQVTPTLEEFLLRVNDRMFLPTDYWDAGEFSGLLREMRPSGGA